ncbi:MAG: pseudoazurin [Pseudomonadota bacterium]
MIARTILAALLLVLWSQNALIAKPKTHVVEMITDKEKKIFDPIFVRVSVGDTVRFVNVSGKHNTESMRGMIPPGAKRWNSKLGKQFDLKISHEGIYAYRCTPHYRQAMVGMIVAGDPRVNLDKVKQAYTIPKVAEIFDKLFDKAVQVDQ